MAVKTQKTYVVSVPPRSAPAAIYQAIAALEDPHDAIELMAASLDFATPREVCGLRALVDLAALRVPEVKLDCPASRDVHAYLERVDFYANLPPNVRLSRPPPSVRRRERSNQLLELTRIRSADDVERLMDRVWTIAQGEVGTGRMAKAFATAIGAATENVVDHANSPIGALVAAQRYKRSGLELAVVDLGCGIPATLRRHSAFAELPDLRAVELALKDGVTSSHEPGRGAGLWELVEGVKAATNATLSVGSGEAEFSLSWRQGRRTRNATTPAHQIRGTWLWIRFEG